jgi:hypothetical protein
MDMKGRLPETLIRDCYSGKSTMNIYISPEGFYKVDFSTGPHEGTASYAGVDERKLSSIMSIPSLALHLRKGHITAEDVDRFMQRHDSPYQPHIPEPSMVHAEPAEAF